jgi:hypothetical protein
MCGASRAKANHALGLLERNHRKPPNVRLPRRAKDGHLSRKLRMASSKNSTRPFNASRGYDARLRTAIRRPGMVNAHARKLRLAPRVGSGNNFRIFNSPAPVEIRAREQIRSFARQRAKVYD